MDRKKKDLRVFDLIPLKMKFFLYTRKGEGMGFFLSFRNALSLAGTSVSSPALFGYLCSCPDKERRFLFCFDS